MTVPDTHPMFPTAAPVEQQILHSLAILGPSTIAELLHYLVRNGAEFSPNTFNIRLSQMATAGKIVRYKRGAYCLPTQQPPAVAPFCEWVMQRLRSIYPGMTTADVLRKEWRAETGRALSKDVFAQELKRLVAQGTAVETLSKGAKEPYYYLASPPGKANDVFA